MHHVAQTQALQQVQALIRAYDKTSLHFPHVNDQHYYDLASSPPRALLLSGPPGVGKSKAVYIAAHQAALPIFTVNPGPNVHHRLVTALKSARRATHAKATLVFIDEIDIICPAVSHNHIHENPSLSTATLRSFLNPPLTNNFSSQTNKNPVVFVIAATNRPNAVHSRLTHPNAFHIQLNLKPPTPEQRLEFLTSLQPKADPQILQHLAQRTPGFVAADLVALCKSARTRAAKNAAQPLHSSQLQISSQNWLHALLHASPSVLRNQNAATVQHTSWEQIGGMEQVKTRLKMAVEWPLRYSSTFKTLGLKAPRGILLHGPPGCSKTTLVRAAASQSLARFVRLSGADIYSCYLGEAERILRDAFATARMAAPCILFLDEIDAIVGKRSTDSMADGNGVQQRVLSTLLTEMDGIVSADGVLVIGATNRVDLLDDALLRPGRFDDILHVDLPDEEGRLQILKIHSAKLSLAAEVNLSDLARHTENYSGADLKSICEEAGLAALREVLTKQRFVDKGQSSIDEAETIEVPRISLRHFDLGGLTSCPQST